METYLSPQSCKVLIALLEQMELVNREYCDEFVRAQGREFGRIAKNFETIFEAGGKAGLKITAP